MKRMFLLAGMMLLWCFGSVLAQEYLEQGRYKLRRSSYDKGLVSGMNVVSFAEKHLTDFVLSERRTTMPRGVFHFFHRNSDNAKIQIIVGVYPTIEIAEEMILELLNFNSLAFEYSSVMGHQIGDNCWWLNYPPFPLRYVFFIRKNMIVALSDISNDYRYRYQQLLELALTLDSEIMNGTQYIPLKDILTPPKINSVSLTKNQLILNESAYATVNVTEPLQKSFVYRCDGPAYNDHEGLKNTFQIPYSLNNAPRTYSLKFWVVNEDNAYSDTEEVKVTFLGPTSVGVENESPQSFTLHQNTPNPFNPSTMICFDLAKSSPVRLVVYSISGQKVRELVSGQMSAGKHSVIWDGKDEHGKAVSSGIYIARLRAEKQVASIKMLLLR
ncbi:MAG: FlgD immunoglobulin-like domain containing protein [Candidatus Latescibacterota bacterium]